jgi:DNA topoisomerase-1
MRLYYDYVNIKKDYINLLAGLSEKPSYMTSQYNHTIESILNGNNHQMNENAFDMMDIMQIGGGNRNQKKWTSIEHNGVIFYPEYEPHGIPIKYDNDKIIHLNPEAEEFITYYVQPRFDKYRNDKFNKNFFKDWKTLLSSEIKRDIVDFSKCNFDDIKVHVLEESERKKNDRSELSKEERDELKKKNDDDKEKYKYAIVDGSKQMIDNFIVEPPTIFVGRGSHPLTGSIKKRLYPSDITLNIGPNMKIPIPVLQGKINDESTAIKRQVWGEIISDNTLEWIASWQNNVTEKYNYARFGRKSIFKMSSDEKKYDLAKLLKKKIKKIRQKNEANMKSSDLETRQLAVALYVIDNLALRIGNEKTEAEADTVGVTTLKIKNISLMENNTIKLDFLGKDSIRYVNKIIVPDIVYNNLKDFYNNKNNNDELFDMITSDSLNKYIKKFMRKLTSKVFRTYNASFTMQTELKKIANKYKDYDKPDKLQKILHEYEMANLKVAKLCNHQKLSQSSTGNQQVEKTEEKIKELQNKIKKMKREKDKKIEEGKKTTALNKKIANAQAKISELKKKKTLQTESRSLSAGTSKINYIDPRITISFLKTMNLFDNIDKFFSKAQQSQFEWAMIIDENYSF